MLLKSFLITVIGLPACGALAFGSLAFILQAWLSGEPLTRGDLFGAIIFGGLSFVVVVFGLLVNRRVRRSRTEDDRFPLLAHAAPYLIAFGAVGGVWFVHHIGKEEAEKRHDEAVAACSRWLAPAAPADAPAKCFPVAVACFRAARAVEEDFVTGRFHPGPDQLPEVLCIREKLAALGYPVVQPKP